jgi:uncharacterized coiled-coil protein SlyX
MTFTSKLQVREFVRQVETSIDNLTDPILISMLQGSADNLNEAYSDNDSAEPVSIGLLVTSMLTDIISHYEEIIEELNLEIRAQDSTIDNAKEYLTNTTSILDKIKNQLELIDHNCLDALNELE